QCVRQVRSQFMFAARHNGGVMRDSLSAYMSAAKSAMSECGEPRENILDYWRQYNADFANCIGPRR
ncbi:MAG TPA: hypothetical protein PKJ97_03855, partial [Candidatus Bilamarchaeaceae archaeon]|nr:hypothetical protein [Candidatus Bilamarchaeaceae archaeon]